MTTTHEKGMTVIIGDEFAKPLFYEESVGAMGIIDSVMSALCGVLVLTGKDIGKVLDVHIQDCLIQEEEEAPIQYGFISITRGMIYYSEDVGLANYAKFVVGGRSKNFEPTSDISAVIDACIETYREGVEWAAHSLDDVNNPQTSSMRKMYEARMKSDKKVSSVQEQVLKIFNEAPAYKPMSLSDLTQSLLSQLGPLQYTGFYQISDDGNVEQIKPNPNHDEYGNEYEDESGS